MLILLPPSETKTQPASGDPAQLQELSLPQLNDDRLRVLKALEKVSGQRNALEALGVGASLAPEVQRNLSLRTAPAAPALQIYTGVLYDALGTETLTAEQRRVAEDSVVVISALWGAVRPVDRIPAYRLSMGTALRGLGKREPVKLSSFWKPRLGEALGTQTEGQLIIDCRSSAYSAAFAAPPETTVAIRAVTEDDDGQRKVVSHFAKHTRGELARHVLEQVGQGRRVETAQELAEAASQRWRVELEEPSVRRPGQLTVVLPA
ncbi:peroxide stress protein YaaA [Kocuria sp. p3-SID1433]|uniref:YaaA family protein n=1 Tax=unclassified Kocuria TaxID=2649579 RepID=UPI0021A6CD2A|nr:MULTISPECIES: peroxide stress protein YaaA [unclassified Kocuria]MCT1602853.1 peroxide stress protein YaaA [Kocuria sp. p3-SID1428]MCT2180815.1 peroxide stress protein YaaA [Kocuria sp. p3-SID1433]